MTIVGDNLGKHVADIDNGVTVANGKCAVEDNPYEPSIQSVESTCRMFCVRVCIMFVFGCRIVCKVVGSLVFVKEEGVVQVNVSKKYLAVSTDTFKLRVSFLST